MAAAYAAVVSVLHIIEKIQMHHTPYIKSFGENPLMVAVRERAIFLQDFLEVYSSSGTQSLESRIADAAYAAEDVLESHIVDRIHDEYNCREGLKNSSIDDSFGQSVEEVIQDMDLIIEKLEIKKMELEELEETKDLQPINTSSVLLPSTSSISPPPNVGTHMMVGFEEYMEQLLEKLTGQGLNRQVIPIVGMGGIGKTTLAKNVHAHSLIVHYFDRRAFVSISQQYNVRKILLDLMSEINGVYVDQESCEDYNKLGERLHKELWGRRYLIVLDDMWSVEAWNRVQLYLPDNGNGSRIMITTRISNLAIDFGSCGMKLRLTR